MELSNGMREIMYVRTDANDRFQILTLQPLLGAIAAGCCAVVKPSEVAPNYAALLYDLLPKYLDSSAFRVVMGGVPETTKLLELQWDHSASQISYPSI